MRATPYSIMIDTCADATSLSPWWRHSAILVMIAGFSILPFVTVLTYTNAPPIPEQADAAGTVVFTGADIQMGQEVFLKYGLMEHGSLWGHGAYLVSCVRSSVPCRLLLEERTSSPCGPYGKRLRKSGSSPGKDFAAHFAREYGTLICGDVGGRKSTGSRP